MSYANPIMQFGIEAFINKTETAGLDGLLLVDVPPDQHQTVIKETTSISMIRLVTATTDIDRLKNIQNNASGFIYYVSVKGTTGTQVPNYKTVEEHLNIIKKQIHLPTVIGFGISNEKVANEMASISDGVIIGSSFLKPFLYAKEEDYTKIGNEQLNFIHSIEKKINTK